MANEEHLKILKQGVKAWNTWQEDRWEKFEWNARALEHRKAYDLIPEFMPKVDLSHAELSGADLTNINLAEANLRYANLTEADLSDALLRGADLTGANVRNAKLVRAHLTGAVLQGADLRGSELHDAYLIAANLSDANLSGASLFGANLSSANLSRSVLNRVIFSRTIFNNVDLSEVKGIETIIHWGPSEVSISTLFKSKGKIPEEFLRGVGIPDQLITFLPSLFRIDEAIQFYSCFISYSHKDENFVRYLYSRMRDEHLRVWYAPEDMRGGKKVHEQLFNAIKTHDKLLFVLSEHSINSEWVVTEIRRARNRGIEEKRQVLFPIRVVDMDRIRSWECFDADSGKDLAVAIREYHIPDFSKWQNQDAFDAAFNRLLRDLRAD